MEEALRSRLELRQAKLVEVSREAESVIGLCHTKGVSEHTLKQSKILLKQCIDRIQSETMQYIEKGNGSSDLMQSCMRDQMAAEDLVDQIEVLLNSATASQENSKENSSSKLPKLELPKYNGDVLKFSEFWDTFEANVGSRNLKDVEKLAYLLASLEGPAKEVVVGLTTTNANYAIAVDILRKHFGGTEKMVDAHYEALNSMQRANNTSTDCRRTLNNIEKHLRVLGTLNEDINSSHLRVIISSKFPDSIMYQVNLLTPEDRSVKSIKIALEKVVTAMESADTEDFTRVASQRAVDHQGPSTTEALHVRAERPPLKRRYPMSNDQPLKKRFTTTISQSIKRRRIQCTFCEQSHYSDQCQQYKSLKERKKKLGDKCYLCFRTGHNSKQCRSKTLCVHCKKRHNRALCFRSTVKDASMKNNKDEQREDRPAGSGNTDESMDTTLMTQNPSNNHKIYLQTAVTKIDDHIVCRLLMDSGSHRSYLTSRIANKLKLKPDREDLLMVYTFGSQKPKEIISPSAEVHITTKRGVQRKIRVNIVSHITNSIPVPEIDVTDEVDLLADDSTVGESIDLLIGNDCYYSFLRPESVKLVDNAYLLNSDFGWLVTGEVRGSDCNHTLSVMTYCQCHQSDCLYFTEPDLPLRNIDMKFLWTLESIGITDSPKTSREEEAVKFFNDTTLHREGRYEVKWPWIQYPPDLPTNFGIAFGRLKGLLKRSDKHTLKEYSDILNEQLQMNIIEVVEPKTSPYEQLIPPITYLPHHMVKQGGKKGRIVYDASAKIKGEKSLNECLYSGPSMLEDLIGLIIKFRTGKIGISADVEKAFLQVALQEQDRDVTRFLWPKDLTKELTEDNLMHLRFCRVPFGIISSPFLLTATIRHHIAKTNKTLLAQVADKCYVDNLVLSVQSEDEALQLYNETRQAFHEISMNIRDWTSNNEQFIQKIPEAQRVKPTDEVKILGLIWQLEQDSLRLNVNKITETNKDTITKKVVLSVLARLYDPCGFVSPAILPAKIIFQELCTRKLKWDEPIPDDLKKKWLHALQVLRMTGDIQVPRYVGNLMPEGEMEYELHCFCDASKDAYATVVYLRMTCQAIRKTAFLMSKSRVTPKEDKDNLKIPRLELLAFLIGSRLTKYVKSNLELNITRQVLWTDSLVVLAWMKTSKLLPPFVQRRVNEIKLNKDLELRYVNTKINPADVATRPELWECEQPLWFYGPEFLLQAEGNWPLVKQSGEESTLVVGEALDNANSPGLIESERDEETRTPVPDAHAENESILRIKELQSRHFPEEVRGKVTHLVRNLGLFADIDGVLRCKGRMANTNWPYDKKYPILLPKVSEFTTEIIKSTHADNYHVGVEHTLSSIRQKYWIPQGRAQIKKVLKRCPKCIKYGGGPYKLPPAPALPVERVNYSTPFTYVGIDYLGPLYVTMRSGEEKRWICLFTCLAVRAVHLEVVNDLTAEECLLALRRFIAARGLPKKIVSDNAMYFKLVSEVLTRPYCMENGIRWRFITQLAPWHGGFYERLVALVKNCLKRTLDKHLLNDHQLMTVVKEIETVINSRPLTALGNEYEHILKPSDFLSLGSCLTPAPSGHVTGSETNTKVDLLKSWKRGHAVMNDFKHMFINQYLLNLRERYNNSHRQPRVKAHKQPQVGDVVQVKDDTKSRSNWKVGKITSLIKSSDGQYRSAKIKVGNSELIRSVGHLYPLEVDIDDADVTTPPEHTPNISVTPQEVSVTEDTLPVQQEPNRKPVHIDEAVEEAVEYQGDTVEMEVDDQPEQDSLGDSQPSAATHEHVEGSQEEVTEKPEEVEELKSKREAAIRAREKIAEWTRQLAALL